MLHHLQSGNYKISISSLGAELHSFIAIDSNEEYIWQGDPSVWAGRAPILFPIVGALKHGEAFINGKPYSINKHGFARNAEFEVVDASKESLTLRLASNAERYKIYPWEFQLDINFQLANNKLSIGYQISNFDKMPMLFNIGSHPAFRLPLRDSQHSDYSIVFDKPETLALYDVVDGLIGTEAAPYLHNENSITLSKEIFANDALVFRNIGSSEISLVHSQTGPRVTVNTGNAPHLGIWAKPGAEYVCIEPWWGHADFTDADGDLAHKDSIQALGAGQVFSTGIAISVY